MICFIQGKWQVKFGELMKERLDNFRAADRKSELGDCFDKVYIDKHKFAGGYEVIFCFSLFF